MKAGRELDALIAEKVMGTEKYWAVMFGGSHYGNYSSREISEQQAAKIQGDHKASLIPYYDEPHYSTDIKAAWEVVEEMNNREMGMELYRFNSEVMPKAHECRFYEDADGYWSASADTAPEAICLAALKAVGQ